jgi:hypothetical protein
VYEVSPGIYLIVISRGWINLPMPGAGTSSTGLVPMLRISRYDTYTTIVCISLVDAHILSQDNCHCPLVVRTWSVAPSLVGSV